MRWGPFGRGSSPSSPVSGGQSPVEIGLQLFDQHLRELKASAGRADFDEGYYLKHRARFERTLGLIPVARAGGARALELGATDFFQVALEQIFNYAEVHGTVFSDRTEDKIRNRTVSIGSRSTYCTTYSLNLENDLFPVGDGYFDLIMCCEVLEHMDIDPMFMLSEVNRVCRDEGILILTTPNCCSARNFWKISHGYRPHFFMQYEISRSPYRHNVEWDVHAVAQLARAAGFEPVELTTADVFEQTMPEALDLLARNKLPTDHRGDCILMVARKTSAVRSRWPDGLYI